MSDDEDTPTLRRPRTASSVITSWGVVEAWLASDITRSVEIFGIAGKGLHVALWTGGSLGEVHPVQPNEDPSATIMRAIGALHA